MAGPPRELKSWNRFVTRHLGVAPELMAQAHCFNFDGSKVTVLLPGIKDVAKDDNARASVCAWWPTGEPVDYVINQVDVEVSRNAEFPLPPEVLTRHPNAFELFNEDEQTKLEEFASAHQSIAEAAFQYWLRVARWVCDDFRIGRNRVEGFQRGWTTYLKDVETNHRVWAMTHGWTLEGYRTISGEEWQRMLGKLSRSDQPPIYRELLHDAEEFLALGDFRRSLVDLAVACETFLRTAVLERLPPQLTAKVLKYLDEANINQYSSHFFADVRPETIQHLGKPRFKKLKEELASLFNRRNGLLHKGHADDLDRTTCERFRKVTRDLLALEAVQTGTASS